MSWRQLGLVFGIGCLATACYRDADKFNAKAAESICRYNAGNPDAPFLDHTAPINDPNDDQPPTDTVPRAKPTRQTTPTESALAGPMPPYEPYSGAYCEETVEANLTTCSDRCDYSPRKARRCLRKLNRGIRNDGYNTAAWDVCDRVYQCSEDTPRDVRAKCRITTQSCAVGGQAPPVVFFALGMLGLWVRRRRT